MAEFIYKRLKLYATTTFDMNVHDFSNYPNYLRDVDIKIALSDYSLADALNSITSGYVIGRDGITIYPLFNTIRDMTNFDFATLFRQSGFSFGSQSLSFNKFFELFDNNNIIDIGFTGAQFNGFCLTTDDSDLFLEFACYSSYPSIAPSYITRGKGETHSSEPLSGITGNFGTLSPSYPSDDEYQHAYFYFPVKFADGTYQTVSFLPANSANLQTEVYAQMQNRVKASVDDWLTELFDAAPIPQPDDPFSPGGTSETGGGGGTFDDTSDAVPDSSLPTLSAANTGFTRIYNPTLAQVQSLAQYLWTNDDFLTTIKNKIIQLVENPMDAIIAFNIVPCAVPDGGTAEFKLMYIPTGVQLTTAAQQYVDVDCGTLDVQEYYGSALDYSPYTKISAFLPYIGTVSLNTDEVMGSTLQIKYRIDIVSGACVAKIFINSNVVYQFSGHCAMTIPVTSADFSRYVSAIMGVAKVAISAGTGVPIGASSNEPAKQMTGIKETTITARNPETGRQRTMSTERVETYRMVEPSQVSFGDWTRMVASNTVSAVMGSKAEVEHSGSFSGNSGYLGIRRPYLIIERPRMCNPAEYGKYNGYPSMVHMSLGDCDGYTEVQSVQLTGIAATNPELGEIGSLLKGGVIL